MENPSIKSWRGVRCLITGGLGFIGSSLAIKLVEAGARVTVADALLPESGGNLFNLETVKDWVQINFCDVRDENIMSVLVKDADVIFHLAAQVSHVRSMSDPYPDIDINIKGTASLMEAVRKVNPDAVVVRTGTRGQYGAAVSLPVAENAPTNPKGLYEISQLTAEKIVQMYHSVHKIDCVLLRLSNIYGPRADMRSSEFGVANWLIRLAMDNRPLTIFGDGSLKRDFVFVTDAVEAILRTAQSKLCNGEIINVGSDEPHTFLQLAHTIKRFVPETEIAHTDFSPERKAQEPSDFYSDIGKIKRLVGWQPTVSLDAGVGETVEFYRRYKEFYW